MFDPWVEKIPWRREWLPNLIFLHGEFHGQRSLVGYSLRVAKRQKQLSDSTTYITESLCCTLETLYIDYT